MPEPSDRSMQDLKPTVWIGKQGCSETMIEEIVAQLKKRKLIKVKWLQSAEVSPEEMARLAKARLVEVRGRTMVLAEKGKGTVAPVRSEKTPKKTPVKRTAQKTARTQGRSAAVQSKKREPAAASAVTAEPARKPRQTGTLKPRKKAE
jgi:RNA-binding protein